MIGVDLESAHCPRKDFGNSHFKGSCAQTTRSRAPQKEAFSTVQVMAKKEDTGGLQKAGIKVFMDVHGLRSNDRYWDIMFKEIDQAVRP